MPSHGSPKVDNARLLQPRARRRAAALSALACVALATSGCGASGRAADGEFSQVVLAEAGSQQPPGPALARLSVADQVDFAILRMIQHRDGSAQTLLVVDQPHGLIVDALKRKLGRRYSERYWWQAMQVISLSCANAPKPLTPVEVKEASRLLAGIAKRLSSKAALPGARDAVCNGDQAWRWRPEED